MRLEKLHLINFRNYDEAEISLEGNVHCFLGRNGSGKTNLLEAIYYLSFTRGKFHAQDEANIRHREKSFVIRGVFEDHGKKEEIICSFSVDSKKTVSANGKFYKRFSEHIGKFPVIMIAPNDIELVWEGGEVRRKYFDVLLSQVDAVYLEQLMRYQHYLRQRNSLLKMFAEGTPVDNVLIDSYDENLFESGAIIFSKRRQFTDRFLPLLQSRYAFIADDHDEEVVLSYTSSLGAESFRSNFKEQLAKDIAAGRTLDGIHRDEYFFGIGGQELKKFGSQGQQKSFLIALKLAEYDYLKQQRGVEPIVLLDDIFDKLDDDRILRLLRLVSEGLGQVFITDARPAGTDSFLAKAKIKAQRILVEKGVIQ